MSYEIETLCDDEHLRLRWLSGDSSRLIVAFTGIGHGMGGVQRDEFVGASSDGGANSTLFVTDRRRSWYSSPGLIDRITDQIEERAAISGATEIATIGNSMGGFGAILFTKYVDVAVAVAFAPQYSMDSSIVADRRWARYRADFGPLPVRSLDDAMNGRTLYFVISGDAPLERAHMERFSNRDNLFRFEVPGADHSVAKALKESGAMREILGLMMAMDVENVRGRLLSEGARTP